MREPKPANFDEQARNVLALYWGEIAAKDVFFRGIRGGFSGSRVWRVELPDSRSFFLKQWPTAGPSASRLQSIHRLMTQIIDITRVTNNNRAVVAVPISNRFGSTVTQYENHLWDLSPELSGSPKDPHLVTVEDVGRAMQAIAETHLALEWIAKQDVHSWPLSGRLGTSPGLQRRHKWLERLVEHPPTFSSATHFSAVPSEVAAKCMALVRAASPLVLPLLNQGDWADFSLPIQPCIRDIWYAHVLFEKSQVTGIIDFGSIGEDCFATDLSRLLRSWFPADDADFGPALDAYHKTRNLSAAERASFQWFDRTSRILSAFQWIEWLAIERREFEDWEAVSERLDFVLARLPQRD